MKKLIPVLLFIICVAYVIVSIYGLYYDLPTNRPKALTIALMISASAGAYYFLQKLKNEQAGKV